MSINASKAIKMIDSYEVDIVIYTDGSCEDFWGLCGGDNRSCVESSGVEDNREERCQIYVLVSRGERTDGRSI
jgi:hypothetical protein